MSFDYKPISEAQHFNPVGADLIEKANENAIYTRKYPRDIKVKLGIL